MKERIPKEFPDISCEPEILSPYDPVSMALYSADGEEMGFLPILPDNIGPKEMQ